MILQEFPAEGFHGNASYLEELQEEFGFFLRAVHVHHGIRGKEADRDQSFVEKICQEWKIPCLSIIMMFRDLAAEWKLGRKRREGLSKRSF